MKTSGYKKLKALQFFAEGYIKDLELAIIGGLVYIKGEVLPSMKQSKYSVAIVFSNNVACKCPAVDNIAWNSILIRESKSFNPVFFWILNSFFSQ